MKTDETVKTEKGSSSEAVAPSRDFAERRAER
jgi:hypothetical protein